MTLVRLVLALLFATATVASGIAGSMSVLAQEEDEEEEPAAVVQEEPPVSPPVATPGGDLPGDVNVQLVQIADGLVDPVNVASPPDGTGRLFVVERPGRIRIIDENGELLEDPFLDITGDVLSAFLEQGMYSVAFHPDFAENGLFYVHFAELLRNGDSVIVQYRVSEDNPNQGDPESATLIMQIDQPWANHNGGEITFGPDGYLYIGMGDGGWEGDPLETGQSIDDLLGTILRIDVTPAVEAALAGEAAGGPIRPGVVGAEETGIYPYAIPADNPFADTPQLVELFGIPEEEFAEIHTQARAEIWNWGLRNPYEFGFDPETGDMYIADVGQNHWEEVNWAPAGAQAGINWGWDVLMGSHCFPLIQETCPEVGVLPVAEYPHEFGCAVIGGGVYRGEESPELDGIYFNSDFCSGRIFGLMRTEDGTWEYEILLDPALQMTGSGQSETGELYFTSCDCAYGREPGVQGAVWRLVSADAVPEGAVTAPLEEAATDDGHEHEHGEEEGAEEAATPEAA